MAQFHPLTVTDIKRDTRDSVIVTLAPRPDATGDFKFIQGQYLTFRRVFDGEEMRRSYSICAGVNDGVLRVGIKKVDGGWFSSWANEELKVGDTLEAMRPTGNFHSPLKPAEARGYLGFAGGSGITPMISLIRTILGAEPKSTFTLVYGNRSTAAIMFREELEDLKNVYLGRFSIVHVLESEAADIDLFSGRLDRAKVDAILRMLPAATTIDAFFVCGPGPMMDAVEQALLARDTPKSKILIERFTTAELSAAQAAAARALEEKAAGLKMSVTLNGRRVSVTFDPSNKSILDNVRAAGLPAPFACKGGACATCKARVTHGEVEMDVRHALEDSEIAAGFVLSCQAHPLSDEVTLDFDRAV